MSKRALNATTTTTERVKIATVSVVQYKKRRLENHHQDDNKESPSNNTPTQEEEEEEIEEIEEVHRTIVIENSSSENAISDWFLDIEQFWIACGYGRYGAIYDTMMQTCKAIRAFFSTTDKLKEVVDACKNDPTFFQLPKWFFRAMPLKNIRPDGYLNAAVWNEEGTRILKFVKVDHSKFERPLSRECVDDVLRCGLFENDAKHARRAKHNVLEKSRGYKKAKKIRFVTDVGEALLNTVQGAEGVKDVGEFMQKGCRLVKKNEGTESTLMSLSTPLLSPEDVETLFRIKERAEKACRGADPERTWLRTMDEVMGGLQSFLTGSLMAFKMEECRPKMEEEEGDLLVSKDWWWCPCKEKEMVHPSDSNANECQCKNEDHGKLIKWNLKDVDLWIKEVILPSDHSRRDRSNSLYVNSWLKDEYFPTKHGYADSFDDAKLKGANWNAMVARYRKRDERLFPEWTEKIPACANLEVISMGRDEKGDAVESCIERFDVQNVSWGWSSVDGLLYCTPLAVCAWEWDEVYVAPTGKNISYDRKETLCVRTVSNGSRKAKLSLRDRSTDFLLDEEEEEEEEVLVKGTDRVVGDFTGDYIADSIEYHSTHCVPSYDRFKFVLSHLDGPTIRMVEGSVIEWAKREGRGGGGEEEEEELEIKKTNQYGGVAFYHPLYHLCSACDEPRLKEIFSKYEKRGYRGSSHEEPKKEELYLGDNPMNLVLNDEQKLLDLKISMRSSLVSWKNRIKKYAMRFEKKRRAGRWHYLQCPLAYNW